MSLWTRLKELLTPTTPDAQYTADNPFVASEPWEWPDDDQKYGHDNIDDEDVVYDFEWAEPDEGDEFAMCYRDRIGKYTRFVAIVQKEEPDENEPIRSYAVALEVIFFKDEQIHGEMREYEYDSQEEDGPGKVTIEVEAYANTLNMPQMAGDDMYMAFDQLEHIGDSIVENGLTEN